MSGRRALWNLTKARPSTAPIGNDALMAALRQLSAQHGQEAAVWKFMSAGNPLLLQHAHTAPAYCLDTALGYE